MGIGKTSVTPTLAVTDLERAREFYGKVLGLKEVAAAIEDKGDIIYEVGDNNYLYVYQRPTPSGSTATACTFDVDDVEGTVEALRNQGITFEEYDLPELNLKTERGIAKIDGSATAWFKDPSGNILAIGNMRAMMRERVGAIPQAQAQPQTTQQPAHA